MGLPGAFRLSGLSWQQVESLDDEALGRRLFRSKQLETERNRSLPDWPQIHQELKRHKAVTLLLLWQEYRERYPEG